MTFSHAVFSFRHLVGSIFTISVYISLFNFPQEMNKRYVDWMNDVFLICVFVEIQVLIHPQHEVSIVSRILAAIILITQETAT